MAPWLVRHHRSLLALLAAATLASLVLIVRPGLREDYSLEAFVASSDPSYRSYRRFLDQFTSNEIAVIAVQADDALSPECLAAIRGLLDKLRALPGVERAQALADIPAWALNLAGRRLTEHRLIAGNLLSRDGRTTAVLLHMHGEGRVAVNRRQTVAELRNVVAQARADHPAMRFVLAGPYVTHIEMYEYVDRDLLLFSIAAFLLMGVTLWIVFRKPGPMLYAMLVGASATLCALGCAIVCGYPTSLVTQMIVILVMVLSVANCVHLAVAGEETAELLPAADSSRRAAETLRRMLIPCIGAMGTTAAAFASVCVSAITPVRVFGLLMVYGLAFALVGGLAGSVLVTSPPACSAGAREKPPNQPLRRPGGSLPAALAAVASWADARRPVVFALFVIAGLASALGFVWLRFESDFVKNFRAGSHVRTSYRFIESNLSPVGSMEIVVATRDGRPILTPEVLAKARALGDDLVARHRPLRKAMTPADLMTLTSPDLPTTPTEVETRLALVRTVFGPDFAHHFLRSDGAALRINLRAVEGVDVHDKLALAEEVRRTAAKTFGPDYSVEVTGLYYFYARLVAGLVRDQYRSAGLTALAVFLALLLTFRSWKAAAVAMIPNLLPILFCLGAMGWSDVPVNMTTAMMLSVTLGISVDATLHYLWRYRAELTRHREVRAALQATSRSVGRACFFTTVVITCGFWILLLSQFLPTAYFGGLVGFTMLGALAADLVLLPALISRFRLFANLPTPM